jgi:hypothetical protein
MEFPQKVEPKEKKMKNRTKKKRNLKDQPRSSDIF